MEASTMDPITQMIAAASSSDCPFCIFITYEVDSTLRVLAQACEFHQEELL